MNEKINETNKNLLLMASEVYSVPFDMLAQVYRLGMSDGYLQGINWEAK